MASPAIVLLRRGRLLESRANALVLPGGDGTAARGVCARRSPLDLARAEASVIAELAGLRRRPMQGIRCAALATIAALSSRGFARQMIAAVALVAKWLDTLITV